MARNSFLLIATSLATLSAVAQEMPNPSPVPADSARKERHWKPRDNRDWNYPRFKDNSKFREMRERLDLMPPEQRREAIEKFRNWQKLPGDEQAHFRFMQDEREKRLQQAVDDTLRSSGLKLDDTQRQRITQIYKRERRKLEEQLRTEMDQRRQDRLPELQKAVLDAFQKEATSTPPPVASPSPTS